MVTTLDSAQTGSGITLSNGNLTGQLNSLTSTWYTSRSTTGKLNGKWYFEVTIDVTEAAGDGRPIVIGVCNAAHSIAGGQYLGVNNTSVGMFADQECWRNGANAGTGYWGPLYRTAGRVIGVALDAGNGNITLHDITNDIWYESFPLSLLTGWPFEFFAGIGFFSAATNAKATINFGNTAFAGAVPTEFAAWDSATIPAVTSCRFVGGPRGGGTVTTTSITGAESNVVQKGASSSNTVWTSLYTNNFQRGGKFYCEITLDDMTGASGTKPQGIGVSNAPSLRGSIGQGSPGGDNCWLGNGTAGNFSVGYYPNNGQVFVNSSVVATIQTATTGDVICMAADLDRKKIWWRKNNGNWNNAAITSQDPSSNIGGVDISGILTGNIPVTPGWDHNSTGTPKATWNFGQSAFAQTVPYGYISWRTETTRRGGPVFVNSDAGINGSTGAATWAPALPTYKREGNLLLAFVQLPSVGGKTFTASNGWTIVAQVNSGSCSVAIAICYVTGIVNGAPSAPTFSWDGTSQVVHSQIFQYKNCWGLGAIGTPTTGVGTTVTTPSITQQKYGGLILQCVFSGPSATVTQPNSNGWTVVTQNGSFADGFGCDMLLENPGTEPGTSFGGETVTIAASTAWAAFTFELLTKGAQ